MVERDLSLAGYEDRPLHLMHLSARESVDALARRAGARGRRHRRGDAAPPRAHRRGRPLARPEREDEPAAPRRPRTGKALIEALRDGTIACVATDHAPHSREEKEAPFEEAPFGVTGLETAFAALYTHLVEPGLLPLETLLERMSAGPARALGLPEPRIEVGARANLVLLDLETEWTVEERRLPLALGELLAARRAATRRRREDRRRRPGGARMSGFLALEDGTIFRGELRRRARASRSARPSSRPR